MPGPVNRPGMLVLSMIKDFSKFLKKVLAKTGCLWYHNDCAENYAAVAQSVERILGKDEVTGSNPVSSSCRLC